MCMPLIHSTTRVMMLLLVFLVLLVLLVPGCGTPSPVPVPTLRGVKEIWIIPHPKVFDVPAMFTLPDQWVNSRAKVKGWKWYMTDLQPACPTCPSNNLDTLKAVGAFRQLEAWNIEQAIEVPTIKEWGCGSAQTLPSTLAGIKAVEDNGGVVTRLSMDEPLYAATTPLYIGAPGFRCGMTMAQAETEVTKYINALKIAYPGMHIWDIEPYPAIPASILAEWIANTPIDGFEVDTDWHQVSDFYGGDLLIMANACRAKGIPFGIIFGGQVNSGQDFVTQMKADVSRVIETGVGFDEASMQSWDPIPIPMNLPETDPSTLTGAILGLTQ